MEEQKGGAAGADTTTEEKFACSGPCESPAAGESHFCSIRCTMDVEMLPRGEKEEKKLKVKGEVTACMREKLQKRT